MKEVKLVGGAPHTWVTLVKDGDVQWNSMWESARKVTSAVGLDPNAWPSWRRYGRGCWVLRVAAPYGQHAGGPRIDSYERRFTTSVPAHRASIRGTEKLWVISPQLKGMSEESTSAESDAIALARVGEDLGLWKVVTK